MGSWGTLLKQCIAIAVAVAIVACIAPSDARLWVVVCGLVSLALFICFSLWRYKEIRDLAAQIDTVLHSGRAIDLTTYREGDVAVLANELGKMVARLARLSDSLTKERNALADALADISHQIRTPLTAISLRLPAIEQADDSLERKRLVRELETMIERLSWLQTTLLKIAKADAGAIHVERQDLLASEVIDRALAPLEASFDLRGIEIVRNMDASATFTGDLLWSAEALQNILKNCMEHTPSGGTVTIVAREDAIATSIIISDSGPGIAEEDLPHLFERFYRGTNDDSSAPDGFGIGLALARSLISIQGGAVRADNVSEGGACFRITFPKLIV